MADLTLNISQYDPLKQFTVRPWETFSPDDQLAITDKINLIIQTLNRLGKLSNDVVTDWNKVMTWVSNDGMTSEVDSQLQKWKDDGTLVALINAYTGIGDLTTLQTVAKDTLVNAINENVGKITANTSSLAEKMKQSDFTNYLNAKMLTEQPQRTRYYLFDSLYRADSTTSLGNAETNNTVYTLASSASPAPIWGIQGNQAYVSNAPVATAGRSIVYQETNEYDCIIECDLNVTIEGNCGLAFRITDINNLWLVTVAQGNFILSKYVAGAVTNIITINKTYSSGRISVLMKGNKIEVYLDGFFITSTYDSFNNTATKHGLYTRADAPNYRWSNFAVKPIGISYVPNKMYEDFEGNLTKWYWTKESPNQSYSQTFSNTIKRIGSNSMRFELHQSDPDVNSSKRCEVYLPAERALEERWYGVSIYLPNGGTEDFAVDTSPEILTQWHTSPDSGEAAVSPPLSLQTINGRYNIVQQVDAGRISSQSNPYTLTMTTTDIGSYIEDKGTWVDWVFHVRWGYSKVHEPITEVYKNGILVYQNNGVPNTMNDQVGVYHKIGIYKWDWHYGNPTLTTSRVVYFDNYWRK